MVSKLTQVAAAAKAGISERSARRIEYSEALPSQREQRAWRTRADPLAPVWDSEVVPLLEADGALNAVTLLVNAGQEPRLFDGEVADFRLRVAPAQGGPGSEIEKVTHQG